MIHARIRARSAEAERRWQTRRDVTIATSAHARESGYDALIRNLSENGLLVETDAPLGVRDSFVVTLPDHGDCEAEVVWVKGALKGCRFHLPVPKCVVSALVLRSPLGDAPHMFEELRSVRMAMAEEEERHMPSALSIPALVMLLGIELAVLYFLFDPFR